MKAMISLMREFRQSMGAGAAGIAATAEQDQMRKRLSSLETQLDQILKRVSALAGSDK